MRQREDIQNYLMQCAFYASAWTSQTRQPIDQIVIVMVSVDGRLRVFKDKPSAHLDRLRELAGQYNCAV
jgi:hypothetical protein